jgi:hypothetical protein
MRRKTRLGLEPLESRITPFRISSITVAFPHGAVPGQEATVHVTVAEDGSFADKGTEDVEISVNGVTLTNMKHDLDLEPVVINCPGCFMNGMMTMLPGTASFTENVTFPKLDPANPQLQPSDPANPYKMHVAITGSFGATGDSDPFDYSWQFGTVGGKKNVQLITTDGTIDTAFAIGGAGTGTLTIPAGQQLFDLSLAGTNNKSIVKSIGAGTTLLRNLTADGNISGLFLDDVDLQGGTMNINGGLLSLRLHDLNNESVTIGGSTDSRISEIEVHLLQDVSIQVASGIGTFLATQWTDTSSPLNDTFSAQDILHLRVNGNFDPALTLIANTTRRSVEDANIEGTVRNKWSVPDLGIIKVENAQQWQVESAGPIANLTVNGFWNNTGLAGLALKSSAILTFHVGDDLIAAPITAIDRVAHFTVGKNVSNSNIQLQGGAGVVQVGSMTDSVLNVTGEMAAFMVTENQADGSISFNHSTVTANDIHSLVLRDVAATSGGTPFGVNAHSIEEYKRFANDKLSFSKAKLIAAVNPYDQFAGATGDFRVTLS